MIVASYQLLVASRNGALAWSGTITENGAVKDMTGWSGTIQFRARPGAPGDPFLSLTTGDPPTSAGSYFSFPDPEAGQFALFIATGDWAGFAEATPVAPTSVSVYDIVLTDPDGVPERYVYGDLQLAEGVTRAA